MRILCECAGPGCPVVHKGDENLSTDMLARARRFRWEDQAQEAALQARDEYAWRGFNWQPRRVAQVLAETQ